MDIKELVFKEIKKLTKQSFNEETEIKSLNIDSLDLVVLISDVEQKLKITISDEELMSFKYIKDIIVLLNNKI
ncbi:acyl carrier protein, putative [Metamycoplasma cloacale]|uniref:Acyl carrier protein n=1 Tax=Metamycoplasma cloacale TaxID=92401 RepID=A0A2Z4LM76_9BACT|nr:acyl carrier protein [Metamycoplasma cloacale]AWX42836.1 acyl carrier protein [Metamycoplasma cloacale]VEU79344.1 acyl carrier protein, putative [Metamycoplasma cloacale]